MSGAVPRHPQYTFMAWCWVERSTGETSPVPFYLQIKWIFRSTCALYAFLYWYRNHTSDNIFSFCLSSCSGPLGYYSLNLWAVEYFPMWTQMFLLRKQVLSSDVLPSKHWSVLSVSALNSSHISQFFFFHLVNFPTKTYFPLSKFRYRQVLP